MITKEKLKSIRKEKKLTQEQFAEILEISRELVGKMERGEEPISKNTIAKIDLLSLKEKKLHNSSVETKQIIPIGKHVISKAAANAYEEWLGLPMYNTPITASFVESYRDDDFYTPQYYLRDPRFKDCDFGAIISGDSMHSEIRHGDFVACKQILDFRFLVFGDIYYIVASNGLETCKYINAGRNENEILLVAKNANISPSPLPKDMIMSVYKVRGIVRGY